MTSSSMTIAVAPSEAPLRRASTANIAKVVATAISCASGSAQMPPECSWEKIHWAITSAFGQPEVGAAANGTPSGTLPVALMVSPMATSQYASAPTSTKIAKKDVTATRLSPVSLPDPL